MPIEIRELVIRAVVSPDGDGRNEAPAGSAAAADKQDGVLADCLEEVARMLREKEER
jgi:hypothetical protein